MAKRRTAAASKASADGAREQDGEVRKEILAAAREAVQRYGFRKLTMDDVARAIGKERSSVYYYFPGKQQLIVALVEQELAEMSEVVRAEVSLHKSAAERFVAYLSSRVQQSLARAEVYRQLLPDFRSGAFFLPQFEEIVRSHDEGESRFVTRILLDGVASGEFRPLSESELTHFARNTISGIRGVELEMFLNPQRARDTNTQIRVSMDIVLRGLLR